MRLLPLQDEAAEECSCSLPLHNVRTQCAGVCLPVRDRALTRETGPSTSDVQPPENSLLLLERSSLAFCYKDAVSAVALAYQISPWPFSNQPTSQRKCCFSGRCSFTPAQNQTSVGQHQLVLLHKYPITNVQNKTIYPRLLLHTHPPFLASHNVTIFLTIRLLYTPASLPHKSNRQQCLLACFHCTFCIHLIPCFQCRLPAQILKPSPPDHHIRLLFHVSGLSFHKTLR